jgi:hypothetical protein
MRPYDVGSAGDPAAVEHPRVEVRGKFLWSGATKFFMRGVSYGPFQPDAMGSPFPSAAQINQDLALMRQAGINTIRTYNVPPQRLLDLALQWNIQVLVGIPWEQHICFLDDRKTARNICAAVSRAVVMKSRRRSCAGMATRR